MSNTSTTDKVAVGGALVGGLLFFGFLTNTCTSPFSLGGNNAASNSEMAHAGVAKVANDDSSQAELQKQLDALKLKNADLSELDKDNDALRREVVSRTKLHSEEKNALETKLRNLQTQLDRSKQSTSALQNKLSAMPTNDSTGLQNKNNELQAELELSATKIKGLKSQIAAMNAASGDANTGNLEAELKATVEKHEAANLLLKKEIKELQLNLAELKKQQIANAANPDLDAAAKATAAMKGQIAGLNTELTGLKTELAAKQGEVRKLTAQVNQFKAQKNVFVKSSNDLPQTAQTLFADLKTLEGKSAEEVKQAYEQITTKNNSEAKARIKFASGKDNLSAAEKAKIADLVAAAGENSYFLIVGYADKTGSAAANEKLSSARSTSVAKELSSKAKGFQAAQAVYLGQTDRFGPASENRVVEIWEIK